MGRAPTGARVQPTPSAFAPSTPRPRAQARRGASPPPPLRPSPGGSAEWGTNHSPALGEARGGRAGRGGDLGRGPSGECRHGRVSGDLTLPCPREEIQLRRVAGDLCRRGCSRPGSLWGRRTSCRRSAEPLRRRGRSRLRDGTTRARLRKPCPRSFPRAPRGDERAGSDRPIRLLQLRGEASPARSRRRCASPAPRAERGAVREAGAMGREGSG